MNAITLYQTIHCEENRPGIACPPFVFSHKPPLFHRFQYERPELFFEAKRFPVVLQDGTFGGILIHKNVLAAERA